MFCYGATRQHENPTALVIGRGLSRVVCLRYVLNSDGARPRTRATCWDHGSRLYVDEADEHRPQADPVRDPSPVTAERVTVLGLWKQRFYRRVDSIEHFGLECAHDGGDLHWVVGFGTHPTSQLGHHGDRWMVSFSPLSARPLSGKMEAQRAASVGRLSTDSRTTFGRRRLLVSLKC